MSVGVSYNENSVPSSRDAQRALVSEIGETRNFCLAQKQQHNLLHSHAQHTYLAGEVMYPELPDGQYLTFKTPPAASSCRQTHTPPFFNLNSGAGYISANSSTVLSPP